MAEAVRDTQRRSYKRDAAPGQNVSCTENMPTVFMSISRDLFSELPYIAKYKILN
jgi:hypothetical protein